jgi:preprotein translocase subunit SecG
MISVLISIGTVVLICVALFLGLIVLAQRAKSDSGMAAMGGGMMESAFGPDTTNVLSRLTIKAAVAFFVLSLLLYLGYVYQRTHPTGSKDALPVISAPATPAPATSAPSATAAPAVTPPAPAATDAAKTTTPGSTPPKSP